MRKYNKIKLSIDGNFNPYGAIPDIDAIIDINDESVAKRFVSIIKKQIKNYNRNNTDDHLYNKINMKEWEGTYPNYCINGPQYFFEFRNGFKEEVEDDNLSNTIYIEATDISHARQYMERHLELCCIKINYKHTGVVFEKESEINGDHGIVSFSGHEFRKYKESQVDVEDYIFNTTVFERFNQ